MSDEFGPWIAHDDSGMPSCLRPEMIVIADLSGDILSPMPARDLDWHCPGDPVSRFRIRKPRGLTILEDLIADLPQPVEVGG